MKQLPAWHEQCTVREEILEGHLDMAEFAADLYRTKVGTAPDVYTAPEKFFSRTYPTHNMKKLVSDVLHRLAGKGGKPVITLQIAYGGGKTHTLITLLHLAAHGHRLHDHPTVGEFMNFSNVPAIPKTRTAILPLDRFDYLKGLEVTAPDGQTRVCHTLWGALAYQLGGDEGFDYVKEHEQHHTPPAQSVLEKVLHLGQRDGCATLILLDEAVMYCRTAVNHDRSRLGTLKDFFQVLTQAVAAHPTCALVSSLIASQIEANDTTGTEVLTALQDVFQRVQELVEPVSEDDVSEVLRRRLFDQLPDTQAIRSMADVMMSAYRHTFSDVLREQQYNKHAAERLLKAYPFHPNLLETLFGKWTQLHSFQKTRGALRFLALAIRETINHDPSPLIGAGALLSPKKEGLSAALNEIVNVTEEKEKWLSILGGEFEKARDCQAVVPGLQYREIEQAVAATFLHSQPRGQKADTPNLYALLIHPVVDSSSLQDGLAKWRDRSWFLKEDQEYWQLTTLPNLTHIHVQAMEQVEPEVATALEERVKKAKGLFECAPGVKKHPLPYSPKDVDDTPFLHYVVLDPALTVEFSKPVPEAIRLYFTSTTHPNNPRTYKNTLILLAAEHSSLAGLRHRMKSLLAWEAIVKNSKLWKELTAEQQRELQRRKKTEHDEIDGYILSAYSAVIAMNEDGELDIRKLPPGNGSHFERITQLLYSEERLITTTLDPELLLPGSYFNIWSEGQQRKTIRELINAFAQFSRLPRLLNHQVIYDSIVRGVEEGTFVAYYARPDGSQVVFWRKPLTLEETYKPDVEIAPLHTAVLEELSADALLPGTLPGLWPEAGGTLTVGAMMTYFDGQQAPKLKEPTVVLKALNDLLLKRRLIARLPEQVFLNEAIPSELFTDDIEVEQAPPKISCADISPNALADAWSAGGATIASLRNALNSARGQDIPDFLVREAIAEGLKSRMFEVTGEGDAMELSIPETITLKGENLSPEALPEAWKNQTSLSGRRLKQALEQKMGRELPDDIFREAIQDAFNRNVFLPASESVNLSNLTTLRVKLPQTVLYAESPLDSRNLQSLPNAIKALKQFAPDIDFKLTLSITAEGTQPERENVAKLNEILAQIDKNLKFEI